MPVELVEGAREDLEVEELTVWKKFPVWFWSDSRRSSWLPLSTRSSKSRSEFNCSPPVQLSPFGRWRGETAIFPEFGKFMAERLLTQEGASLNF